MSIYELSFRKGGFAIHTCAEIPSAAKADSVASRYNTTAGDERSAKLRGVSGRVENRTYSPSREVGSTCEGVLYVALVSDSYKVFESYKVLLYELLLEFLPGLLRNSLGNDLLS